MMKHVPALIVAHINSALIVLALGLTRPVTLAQTAKKKLTKLSAKTKKQWSKTKIHLWRKSMMVRLIASIAMI
jgi:hypothetical protein